MKKILLTLVGLSALMSIHAQVVEIYKNGQLMQTFYNSPNSQYEVVFKSSGDQGIINGHEYIEIAGRKWATMNVGATSVADSSATDLALGQQIDRKIGSKCRQCCACSLFHVLERGWLLGLIS